MELEAESQGDEHVLIWLLRIDISFVVHVGALGRFYTQPHVSQPIKLIWWHRYRIIGTPKVIILMDFNTRYHSFPSEYSVHVSSQLHKSKKHRCNFPIEICHNVWSFDRLSLKYRRKNVFDKSEQIKDSPVAMMNRFGDGSTHSPPTKDINHCNNLSVRWLNIIPDLILENFRTWS